MITRKFEMPHPAIVCGGNQLLSVIAELEAGTYPQPGCAVWRDDLPRDLAIRLAKATGATDEQIAGITRTCGCGHPAAAHDIGIGVCDDCDCDAMKAAGR